MSSNAKKSKKLLHREQQTKVFFKSMLDKLESSEQWRNNEAVTEENMPSSEPNKKPVNCMKWMITTFAASMCCLLCMSIMLPLMLAPDETEKKYSHNLKNVVTERIEDDNLTVIRTRDDVLFFNADKIGGFALAETDKPEDNPNEVLSYSVMSCSINIGGDSDIAVLTVDYRVRFNENYTFIHKEFYNYLIESFETNVFVFEDKQLTVKKFTIGSTEVRYYEIEENSKKHAYLMFIYRGHEYFLKVMEGTNNMPPHMCGTIDKSNLTKLTGLLICNK